MAYFYKVVAEEACKCSCKFTCKGCLHLVMGKGDQPNEDVCTEKKKIYYYYLEILSAQYKFNT